MERIGKGSQGSLDVLCLHFYLVCWKPVPNGCLLQTAVPWRSLTFADGDTINGHILKDHASLGGLEATEGIWDGLCKSNPTAVDQTRQPYVSDACNSDLQIFAWLQL